MQKISELLPNVLMEKLGPLMISCEPGRISNPNDGIDAAIKLRKENIEYFLYNYGVGRRFIESSFDNFDFRTSPDAAALLVEFLRKYVNISPLPSLYLHGISGNGKSHLVVAILRELILLGRDWKKTVKMITSADILLEIKACFDRKDESEFSLISKYANYDLLFLEDLGAEMSGEWTVVTLYSILDKRYWWTKPTVVTSNMNLAELEKKLGTRIASRLSHGIVKENMMPDYRKKR